MSLKNKIELALSDLKNGKLIVVSDDENRENEGDLIGLQEFIKPQDINFMITHGKGLLCVSISEKIAYTHELYLLEKHNSDGTNFTISIDGPNTTTGISAFERFETTQSLLKTKKVNFKSPGHTFPLIAKNGGLSSRRGHTEAVIDLAKLAQAKEVGVLVEVVGNNGKMMKGSELHEFVKKHNLTHIYTEEIIQYIKKYQPNIFHKTKISNRFEFSKNSILPTKFGKFNITIIKDKRFNKDYSLVYKGELKNLDHSFARFHSACLTSESFFSERCDCREQLNFTLNMISEKNKGLLLYSPDEGRGIGIFDKINAYHLQDQGLDTFDANVQLKYNPDERNFKVQALIFKELGITNINLITNNPDKIQALKNENINVNRIKFWFENKHNSNYLKTKIKRMGHLKTKKNERD